MDHALATVTPFLDQLGCKIEITLQPPCVTATPAPAPDQYVQSDQSDQTHPQNPVDAEIELDFFDQLDLMLASEPEPTAEDLAQDKLDEIQHKIAQCGKFGKYVNPLTGTFDSHPNYCHQWHTDQPLWCEGCVQRRQNELFMQLRDAITNSPSPMTMMVFGDQADLDQVLAGEELTKDKYHRLPTATTDRILVPEHTARQLHEKAAAIGVTYEKSDFNAETLATLDMRDLSQTPTGRRQSGSLTKPNVIATVSERVPVQVIDIVAEGDLKAAERDAYAETADLNPHDAIELEAAIAIRTAAYVDAVLRRGGQILLRSVRFVPVEITRISWIKTNSFSAGSVHNPPGQGEK